MYTFQEIIAKLSAFWEKQGCLICSPYDLEKGAGTFNPATFMRCLGPEPFRAAYIEPCRRPKDGRYGTNPIRAQHYFQYQVILKPSPYDIQDLYLKSLEAMGFVLKDYDLRFVHDDWEQPTLGAWGLGWEVWIDGLESSQFTYFQAVAGIPLKPITGELTYGLERLAMHLQRVDSMFDLQWNDYLTYGDLYKRNEFEGSTYNFEKSNPQMWFKHFEDYQKEVLRLCKEKLPLPAYDFVIKASHAFNLLDTRGVISVAERASYIAAIRDLAKAVAECFLNQRKEAGYPLLNKWPETISNPTFPNATKKVTTTSFSKEPQDFLLEIGCEELPAEFVTIGYRNLEKEMKALFQTHNLSHSGIEVMGTPRRLAILVKNLAPSSKVEAVEKKGPSVIQAFNNGTLTSIGEGFLRSCGIAPLTLAELEVGKEKRLEIRQFKNESYLFAKIVKEEVNTPLLLEKELSQIILGIDFPKKMRWANLDIAFGRPIRWIVALFGKEVIPFMVGPIHSGHTSWGHRQLANAPCEIEHASEYKATLKKVMVLVDVEERLHEIEKQLQKIEHETHTCTLKRQRVRQEVLHLVEWPFLTVAEFDAAFLQAPQEVLICEMVEHQRYFPMADATGKLKNSFIITANVPPTDAIRNGNRKVISSRLADGVFLFEQDKKKRLEDFNEKLKSSVFQKGLGTVYDKVQRIRSCTHILAKLIPGANRAFLEEAAMLCKADLASEMVGEFEELQGDMGRIYASLQGKPLEVAQAIGEHWMPRGENSPLPQTLTGALLSIADKIDSLLGFFGLDIKPTSSSDPHALRRQALGIVKIIVEHKLPLALIPLMQQHITAFPQEIQAKKDTIITEVLQFLVARAKGIFQDMGFSKDEIEACLSCRQDAFYDILCRLTALKKFRAAHETFGKLVEVQKRSYGQINSFPAPLPFKKELLCEAEEQVLWNILERIEHPFMQAIEKQNYESALDMLISLQAPLAHLFDNVKVLADDPALQTNRLALLQRVARLFSEIGDFQKLQIAGS